MGERAAVCNPMSFWVSVSSLTITSPLVPRDTRDSSFFSGALAVFSLSFSEQPEDNTKTAKTAIRALTSQPELEGIIDLERISATGMENFIGQCGRALDGIFQGCGCLLKLDFAVKLHQFGGGKLELSVQEIELVGCASFQLLANR